MAISDKEHRKYFRHPIHAPLKLRTKSAEEISIPESSDISLGGLSFFWSARLSKGNLITVSIPVKQKSFEIKGRVVYSIEDSKTGKYRTGISFIDPPSAFRAKLAEEALEILQYRRTLSQEKGEQISEEEAANRWIQKFAEGFAI